MIPSRRRITATDVARLAGVSQPTVSLVLSGNTEARLAPETRARVLAAAEELGYRPNIVAQALKQRRSYALGLIVPDLENPYYTEIVTGAERVAAEAGYAVLLCDARATSPARHLEMLRARWIDGVIVDAVGAADLPQHALRDMNVVLVGEPSDVLPWVAADAESAGRQAAAHLLELGHRSLGFVGPASPLYRFRMRERGFVQALREAGISIRSDWLRRGPPTLSGGAREMAKLLSGVERPTGVFCANDLIALGALKECTRRGVAVPADMSIVGCDDIELARVVTPELTTVAVPAKEAGARAARRLLDVIEGRAGRPRSQRPLPVKLQVRDTTAAPRGSS
ncbi:MAG TPA: LacI family DNA-binding transcriptional regulator [Longimicrobiales bacterium]|nr:LacI family DNA-binding transcriptional regulator [Longimicrobiales bacterium]